MGEKRVSGTTEGMAVGVTVPPESRVSISVSQRDTCEAVDSIRLESA